MLIILLGTLNTFTPAFASCVNRVTDTNSVRSDEGCTSFTFEGIKFSTSEVSKISREYEGTTYNFQIKISVNEPKVIRYLNIVPFHYENEINRFDGETYCAVDSRLNAESQPEVFSNFTTDGLRKTYTFELQGVVYHSCAPGEIYIGVRPTTDQSSGFLLRGKTLSGNKLNVKSATRNEGVLCESSDQSTQVKNSDGSIWICARGSFTSFFKWKLVSGSKPVSVVNCLMACSTVIVTPSQGLNSKTPPPTLTKEPVSKSSTLSNCSKAGQLKKNGKDTYACVLDGKKLKWVPLAGGSSNKSSPKPILSEADQYASTGCKTFPSAIVLFQNASGASYNKAFMAAQEAGFNLSQAGRLDSKYQVLSNAQFIIIQYVQAVGFGGRGYSGDVNTVRTALATFNSLCNSNLSIK